MFDYCTLWGSDTYIDGAWRVSFEILIVGSKRPFYLIQIFPSQLTWPYLAKLFSIYHRSGMSLPKIFNDKITLFPWLQIFFKCYPSTGTHTVVTCIHDYRTTHHNLHDFCCKFSSAEIWNDWTFTPFQLRLRDEIDRLGPVLIPFNGQSIKQESLKHSEECQSPVMHSNLDDLL